MRFGELTDNLNRNTMKMKHVYSVLYKDKSLALALFCLFCLPVSGLANSRAKTFYGYELNNECVVPVKDVAESRDGKGCWRMILIGDSAYKHQSMVPATKHYKFYGRRSALTINLLGESKDGYLYFVGATGRYKEKSDNYVVESGLRRPRHWIDDNSFDETWKDVKGISFVKGLWKTERWQRCDTVPELLQEALSSYKEGRQRVDEFNGCWQLRAVRNQQTGEMENVSLKQYKFYGNSAYITFVIAPMNARKLFYTFSGNYGKFEYVNENLVREHDSDFQVTWNGTGKFTIKFKLNGRDWEEEWERVSVPRFLRRIFKATL